MTWELAFWMLAFFFGLGCLLIYRELRNFLRPAEIEVEDKYDTLKVWSAFLDIEEEIKKESPTVAYPGIETVWIVEKAGFSHGKTLEALNELEKEGHIHMIYPRWYSGRGSARMQ